MILLVTGCRAIAWLMAAEPGPRLPGPVAGPSRVISVRDAKPRPIGPG
jgi:hypothetical protein